MTKIVCRSSISIFLLFRWLRKLKTAFPNLLCSKIWSHNLGLTNDIQLEKEYAIFSSGLKGK